MPIISLFVWMILNIAGFWICKRFFGISRKAQTGVMAFFFVPVLLLVRLIAWDPLISVISGRLPGYVLSGKLFTERFDIHHAGSALDQPTIGKWLFWFTVMAVLSLPYITTVRRICGISSRIGNWVFAVLTAADCILLLCILSWPVCWLIQYICSMGLTMKRLLGLIYGIAAGIGVVLFFIRITARHPEMLPAAEQESTLKK